MRPPERKSRRSANALAPISISGPPGQAVAIFQLYFWPDGCAATGVAASAAVAAAPAFRNSRFFMLSSSVRKSGRHHGSVDGDRGIRAAELLDHRLQLRLDVVLVVAVEHVARQAAVEVARSHEPVGD